MNIYEPINKQFLENKKINVSFSKALNHKEKSFLKFLFTKYDLLKKLEKTTVLKEIDLKYILEILKSSTFEKLKKIFG